MGVSPAAPPIPGPGDQALNPSTYASSPHPTPRASPARMLLLKTYGEGSEVNMQEASSIHHPVWRSRRRKAAPSSQMPGGSPQRFLADAMLGKLARWLRILGYDTAYERTIDDDELIRRLLEEGRWLLTRDRHLAQRRVLRGRLTLLQSDHVPDQLRELASDQHLELKLGSNTACRCADCNALLVPISKEQVLKNVPPLVAQEQDEFARCPSCGRLFWPGSHWQRLTSELTRLRQSSRRSDR